MLLAQPQFHPRMNPRLTEVNPRPIPTRRLSRKLSRNPSQSFRRRRRPSPPSRSSPPKLRRRRNASPNSDLGDIYDEHAANPFRAGDRYVGEQICLTGEIGLFHINDYGFRIIVAFTGNDPQSDLRFTISEPERSEALDSGMSMEKLRRWNDWQSLFMEASVGDEIKAECQITGIGDGVERRDGSRVFRKGVPVLGRCEWVESEKAAKSRSASTSTKALTWEFVGAWMDSQQFRVGVYLDVPSDWDWHDPYYDPEKEDDEYREEPWEKYVQFPDESLPLVVMMRGVWVWDMRDVEGYLHHDGLEAADIEVSEVTVGDADATFVTYTLSTDGHSEWVTSVFLMKGTGKDQISGVWVRCHADAEDSRGRAECQAVIESARLQ